ncbi:hypothetical protein ACRCJU_02195 [Aerococcus urinaeequi]|uniref:hypothetical protein n=1 Tax=Aerococcus urinaeequi TaxID=51665 RepID=UPI003AACFF21
MGSYIKVSMIPDNTRIVINYGSDNDENLDIGTKIIVFEEGPNIKDLETGEIIDQYAIVKKRLTITEVYKNYSVARNEKIVNIPSFGTSLVSPMLRNRQQKEYDVINVNEKENLNLNLDNPIINLGDLVRIID